MSLRQDRLTFFGVLVAVVIAVVGYLQLGSMYPVEGRAEQPDAARDDQAGTADNETQDKKMRNTPVAGQEDHAP